MLRAVVLLRFERLQTRDEHQTFVAFQAFYLGGVDEVAPEYLVGLGIRALLALRLRDGGVVHRGLAYLLGDLLVGLAGLRSREQQRSSSIAVRVLSSEVIPIRVRTSAMIPPKQRFCGDNMSYAIVGEAVRLVWSSSIFLVAAGSLYRPTKTI